MPAQNEFRGLWADAWGAGFLNASQVTQLVNDCKTYNYNAIVVQIRRRGDAFYMPQAPNLEPRTTAVAANYDALQELINQCHNSNPRIEVHAWIPTFLVGDANSPNNPNHVMNQRPELMMENFSGAKAIGEGYYLDPGHPEAQLWNFTVAKDIVSRYDVDGFHWDYIRYPQVDSGYNPTAIARYNAEFGLTGKPSSSSTQFSNWRRRQVTDFLRWTSADLYEIKPGIVISCSVFGSRSDAFNARYQDWSAWNNEGILDICMPMNYVNQISLPTTFYTRTDDAFNHQGVRRIYMGQGAYLNTKENTVAQLQYAKSKPFMGTMYYSYRVPNSGTVDRPATMTYVKNNLQPTWVNTPSLPWKITPTKGILKGTVVRQDSGGGIYNATISLSGASSRSLATDGLGKFAFHEATPGSYTVTVTPLGLSPVTTNVTLSAGQIRHLNFVISINDTLAPQISGITVTNITENSATIRWSTDELADSAVDYGLTSGYGATTSLPTLTVNHSIQLSNLDDNATYHFRIRSKDASNNQSSTTNLTFITNPRGIVSDLIIDNPEAVLVGAWSTGTLATDKYGADYYFAGNTLTRSVTFTPTITTAGTYDVFEWHSAGGNRATNTPHIIKFNGGQDIVTVNQRINGGKWNLVGRYNFAAGTGGNVTITNNFTGASGDVAMADAIKFSFVPPIPAAPTSLSASTLSDSEIALTWQGPIYAYGYVIARSTSPGGPFLDIGSTSSGTLTNFVDTELTESTRYYYVVKAVNTSGSSPASTSANAMTLAGLPVIVTQPLGQVAQEGDPVTISVVARAAVPTYQWQFNFQDIPGATASSYTIHAVDGIHDGEYAVRVTNPTGSVLSDQARLRVNFRLTIIASPGGTTFRNPNQANYPFGENVTVTAVANAGWQFVGWSGDILGTNNPSLVTMTSSKTVTPHFMRASDIIVDNNQAGFIGEWTLGQASGDKYGTSYHYTKTTNTAATARAFFTPNVELPGKYNVFYWFPGENTRTTNAQISLFHNGGSLSTNATQTITNAGWRVLAKGRDFAAGTGGSVQLANNTGETNKYLVADAMRFTLVNPPEIIVQPTGAAVESGTPVSMGVLASGNNLIYQWQRSGTNIPGANNTSYNLASAQVSDSGTYNVLIANDAAVIASANTILTVTNNVIYQLRSGTMTPSHFEFQLFAEPGDYIVEVSTDLVNWQDVANITIIDDPVIVQDTAATNIHTRFYRTRIAP